MFLEKAQRDIELFYNTTPLMCNSDSASLTTSGQPVLRMEISPRHRDHGFASASATQLLISGGSECTKNFHCSC